MRGMANDVYCQIGLVLLIGLSAKNAILIVEFAEQLRAKGRTIVDAAIEAGELRLRPILMTSFAFILGVLPLAIASGAGALGRRSVGTTIVGGMMRFHRAESVLHPRALRDLQSGAGKDHPQAASRPVECARCGPGHRDSRIGGMVP